MLPWDITSAKAGKKSASQKKGAQKSKSNETMFKDEIRAQIQNGAKEKIVSHNPCDVFKAQNHVARTHDRDAVSYGLYVKANAGFILVPGNGFYYVHSDGVALPVIKGKVCQCGYVHHT